MSKDKELSSQKDTSQQLAEMLSAIIHASGKPASRLSKITIQFLIANKKLWRGEFQEKIEDIFKKYSMEDVSLYALMKRNASYDCPLTALEEEQALFLINNPQVTKEKCSLCTEKAIHDTGLCQGHARYAFVTQK